MFRVSQFCRVVFLFAFVAECFAAEGSKPPSEVIRRYCVDCHDAEVKKGSLDLEALLGEPIPRHAAAWEKAVRKMQARQMPPVGKKRPDEEGYRSLVAELTRALDAAAAKN